MSERVKLFWLGILIIAVIVITAWLLLFLKPSVGDGKETIRVRFTNIEKISVGTWVTYAGKPVGEVVEINEIFDARNRPANKYGDLYYYELVLKVDSSVKIYNYDEIVFTTSGLMGEKSIAIIPKTAPPGAPPAHEITNEILYARSTDTIEEALSQVTRASDSIKETMQKLDAFIVENKSDFNLTLKSLTKATKKISDMLDKVHETDVIAKTAQAASSLHSAMVRADRFFTDMLDRNIIERLSYTLDNVYDVTDKISNGEGTLGRLLHSDSFYLQITGLMCKFETVLSDIQSYGLLFQYDRSWQRKRLCQMNRLRSLCSPQDFSRFFNEELCSIHTNLDRVSNALNLSDCEEIPIDNACFAQGFRELLDRVGDLEKTLKSYNEMLFDQYCRG